MLVRPNHRAVDVVRLPIEAALRIGVLLEGVQDALPAPLGPPAIEAAGDRGPGAVALGDIAPGRAGAVEPEQPVDHAAVVDVGLAALAALRRPLWREQRRQPRPLPIGQVMPGACVIRAHATKYTGFAYTP